MNHIVSTERQNADLFHAPIDAPAAEASALLSVITRAASDPSIDVNKMAALLEMHAQIETKHAERQFHAAMTAAQGEMKRVAADANNPQTKSKYASYPALDRALRPVYTKHGFALSFDTGDGAAENFVRVLCHVSHTAGHSRTYRIDMPADGKGAKGGDVMTKTHATGAALSYGARYLLKLIFNVAVGEDDDDGNGADPFAKITPDQVAGISELIHRTHADIEKFCKYMGVEALADIKAKDFARAVTALNLKEKKVAK